jgi:replicative DNA helicase
VADQALRTVDVNAFVAEVQTQALAISESGVKVKLQSIQPILGRFIQLLEKRKNGRQTITGIKTGLHMLDNMTCGLQEGEMFVVGARPSVGKTALGVTLSIQALRQGRKVAFFSVEMGEQSLVPRFLGAVSRVDTLKMRNGFVSTSDELRLVKAVEEMAQWKSSLFIDDRSDLTGRDFFTAARRAKRDHGVSMVVVDYLQLMHAVRQHGTREGEVGEVADWIKRTAKDLNLVVVALAQTNKDSEKDRNPREPRMSDLRESDRICQNADVVGLLWAPKIDDKEYLDMKWIAHHDADDPKPPVPEKNDGWCGARTTATYKDSKVEFPIDWRREITFVQMLIAKNRNGATGPCELVLQRRTTRFVDAYAPDYGQKRVQSEMEGVAI